MIELEINHQVMRVKEGTNIIDAAEDHGIDIPRFCYHKKLSVVANCRMCLVEVEGVRKPLPACATTATDGMRVLTQSKMALEAQRAVMEFLLINHPLDCPICDQGGECELQDQAVGFGQANSHYHRAKRAVASQNMGPLIATEMTRCIHCTRCIRVSQEIGGIRELGAFGRGGQMEIGTYVEKAVESELSGNMIDVCPVGALTSKPYAYHGRAWELQAHRSIAAHDCLGSHLYIHTRTLEYQPQREVMRVVPCAYDPINENWLSDRDRFSYLGLNHAERNLKPLVKKANQWHTADWTFVLSTIADRLKWAMDRKGAKSIGALVSSSSTTEECFLMQKLMRALGSPHIDHRLRTEDFSDQHMLPPYLGFSSPIAELETCDAILLVGSHLRCEVPLINYRLLKASQEGAAIMAINVYDYSFNYPLKQKRIVGLNHWVMALAQVLKALLDSKRATLHESWINELVPDEKSKRMAQTLLDAKKPCLILGLEALTHPQASSLRAMAQKIAKYSEAQVHCITDGANSTGASLAGALPHRKPAARPCLEPGFNAAQMLTRPLSAYFLLNIEPEYDAAYAASAIEHLSKAPLVVCLSPFCTERMKHYADVILPIAPVTETDGTFVNIVGDWQSFKAASLPFGESKPAWEVLSLLAHCLDLPGFDYSSSQGVLAELKAQMEEMAFVAAPEPLSAIKACQDACHKHGKSLMRHGYWPMVCVDSMVRRSKPLQQTLAQSMALAVMHPKTAEQLGFANGDGVIVRQGESKLQLTVAMDEACAQETVSIPMGLKQTQGFGVAMSEIALERGEA